MQLGYVILYVPEVTASVEFYERAFGIARRFVSESGEYAEMETGATALAFAAESFIAAAGHSFRVSRPNEMPAGVEIAFVADDVKAGFDQAISAGCTPQDVPQQKPWGQTVAYVRDLNGFLIELCSAMNG